MNNTPVRLILNSSLILTIHVNPKTTNTLRINTKLNRNNHENTATKKQQKNRREKRDYLQDLYGTLELTTTAYKLKNYNAIKRNFLNYVRE